MTERDIVERLHTTYDAWNNPPSDGLPDGANAALEAAAEITSLRSALAEARRERDEARAARDAARDMRDAQMDYAIDLQRIIEDLCDGRPIRHPETTAKHHYQMARARQASVAAAESSRDTAVEALREAGTRLKIVAEAVAGDHHALAKSCSRMADGIDATLTKLGAAK